MPDKKYYQKNKEKILKRVKEYRKTEKGKSVHKKANAKYRENNKEKFRENTKQWRKNNPEKYLKYHKQYYKDNQEEIKNQIKQKQIKIKQYLDEYKLSKGCERCGYNKCPEALHFHHKGNKEFCISKAIYDKKPLKKIKEEIKKCEILCANCHAEITFNKEEKDNLPNRRGNAGNKITSNSRG